MSVADSYNSDDERYADDTFEQESDTDVPEMAEIESEISEVDEDYDERLPSVKVNTGPIIRSLNYTTTTNNTDAVPFDSSSDEEDDVIVGQTLAEINTPSMQFEDSPSTTPIRREIRPVRYESNRHLKSVDEQSESSVSEEEEEDSDDEREFQRIQEMEERYLLQNSAKIPRTPSITSQRQVNDENNSDSDGQKTTTNEIYLDKEPVLRGTPINSENNASEPEVDPIPELIERVMENFTPKPQVPAQIQTDFMETVQNSLASLQTDTTAVEPNDNIITNDMNQPSKADDSIRMTFSLEPNHTLNPENIAMALFNAMTSTTATYVANHAVSQTIHRQEVSHEIAKVNVESVQNHNTSESNERESDRNDNIEANDKDDNHGDKEVELEHLDSTSPPPVSDVDDEESYYDTQFEYHITSRTPSCFNSEDYVFHANFIRPTPTTDKLRARPHPRKSMSFSNERMREIERHNQILLRKILTQKPSYMLNSAQHKVQRNNSNTQRNERLTTSALNRKKQQRQIDLDNQVLKRKIEAIAIRRRPLIS